MRDRFLDLWDRRNGVWNAGVYVVFASIDAALSQGVFRIVWIAISVAAFVGGTVTLIQQRSAGRRSRELADEPTRGIGQDATGSKGNKDAGDAAELDA